MDWLWWYSFVLNNRKRLQYLLTMNVQLKFTILWCIFVFGSLFHDFMPLPPSYFSLRNNFFNVFFVKKGWGWTSGLLFAFLLSLLSKQKQSNVIVCFKNISRIFVLTLTWYLFTSFFETIESYTGNCVGDNNLNIKEVCRNSGFLWNGFDISGHCFLLTYCTLVINEELLATMNVVIQINNNDNNKLKKAYKFLGFDFSAVLFDWLIEFFSASLLLLMLLWEVMLFFTCAYFHTLMQKFLGVCFGLLAYYICYRVIFILKHPLAPCEPGEFLII
ncbi:acyl-coenzyme A diphosphatase FITM2 [Hydra vulgaris]|nr:acyl-coenzyme A diphosphatase FITM2 [Hydra vulgaris]XP_047142032.1 acyl-coenzyme A diphosphatase FITM2 [Hydra vulgaris]